MRLEVLDSHTEGEPTRTVVGGWPVLRGATLAERLEDQRTHWDHLRCALLREPRGHDGLVGAILTDPVSPGAATGAIFCNDVGYLGMCGHGTIGVVRTLAHLARIEPGPLRIDTPAGTVAATLHPGGAISVENVPAFCAARDVAVDVPGLGRVVGDVAYGGNWFFLTALPGVPLVPAAIAELLAATTAIRTALAEAGIGGSDGEPIDHVELSGPPARSDADARNFVLCPGRAYDRSPCGTGTSAAMAARHARGQLGIAVPWRQESITGSLFEGVLAQCEGLLIPTIRGRAYVTAEATLLLDPADPLRYGSADA